MQAQPGTIDTVHYYFQGVAEDSLLNNPNFPNNIYGIPSRKASKNIPTSSLKEIEAIGIGGEIIVGFKGKVVVNKPGPDFVIFENAFVNPVTFGIFAEPAIISVSKDGKNYFEFPFDKNSLEGLAGLNPTYGDKDPFNYEISGGDAFDLDLVGLDYIKYIKIKDTTMIIKGLTNSHKYWSPEFLLTGFDLDAVVGINLDDEATSFDDELSPVKFMLYPNPANDFINFDNATHLISKIIMIYDIYGKKVKEIEYNNSAINISELAKGFYLIRIDNLQFQFIKY